MHEFNILEKIKNIKFFKSPRIYTFEDLEFEDDVEFKLIGRILKRAKFEFPNRYSISVVTGDVLHIWIEEKMLYEVAIMNDGELCFDTYITNDVIGGLRPYEVTELMHKIASLKNRRTPSGKFLESKFGALFFKLYRFVLVLLKISK